MLEPVGICSYCCAALCLAFQLRVRPPKKILSPDLVQENRIHTLHLDQCYSNIISVGKGKQVFANHVSFRKSLSECSGCMAIVRQCDLA